MTLQKLVFKRESLTLPRKQLDDTFKDERWDHLTIYDETTGLVVERTPGHHPEGDIHLIYKGFKIVAPPLAKTYGESYIYITIQSIKEQINKK